VRADFWSKPAGTLCQPFFTFAGMLRGLVSRHRRPATPTRVRGVLLAVLVYFIFRLRPRPLTWLGRFAGLAFTDDAVVLTAVFGPSSHIVHRAAAAD